MAKPFKYRGRWRAQVEVNGQRSVHDFDDHREACHWSAAEETRLCTGVPEELGGPTQATLAELLHHYAHLVTVNKRGIDHELRRISHYLVPAGLPALRVQRVSEKHFELVEVAAATIDASVPRDWVAYLKRRRAQRANTYALMGTLSRRRCSTLTTPDIEKLMATMTKEGLSESSIQKEIALLKAAFNHATQHWGWTGFKNPCAGLKLGKSTPRFVRLTQEEMDRLVAALAACDNPYFWPLVDCAIFITGRLDSLLALHWEHIDLEARVLQFRSKAGSVRIPLDKRVVEVLGRLPTAPSGCVFPMSKNAVKCAWNGVRAAAGLPKFQFRDLRHLGGTHYARRIRNPELLRRILGHKTDAMAKVYINLTNEDLLQELDANPARASALVPPLPPGAPAFSAEAMARKKAARLIAGRKAQLARASAGSEAPTAPAQRSAEIIDFPVRRAG